MGKSVETEKRAASIEASHAVRCRQKRAGIPTPPGGKACRLRAEALPDPQRQAIAEVVRSVRAETPAPALRRVRIGTDDDDANREQLRNLARSISRGGGVRQSARERGKGAKRSPRSLLPCTVR